jgi:hypothetical protein
LRCETCEVFRESHLTNGQCIRAYDNGRVEKLQSWRILQQLDYVFEQTTGAAAVDAAMVEA